MRSRTAYSSRWPPSIVVMLTKRQRFASVPSSASMAARAAGPAPSNSTRSGVSGFGAASSSSRSAEIFCRRSATRFATWANWSGASERRISWSSIETNWWVRLATASARRSRCSAAPPWSAPGTRPKSLHQRRRSTRLNTTESAAAMPVAWTPHASPTAMARKMNTASLLSSSRFRKLTAATMPASAKASPTLFFTTTTTPATTTGRMSSVCTSDWR